MAYRITLWSGLLAMCNLLAAQPDEALPGVLTSDRQKKSLLPFYADWAEKKGIALPRPYSVSGFFTFMARTVSRKGQAAYICKLVPAVS